MYNGDGLEEREEFIDLSPQPFGLYTKPYPPYFALSILFLSLDFLSMYRSLLSQPPFFAVILACITSPLPSPVSRELLSRSEELFMLPSNDLLSASFLRPFFSASLSAHPHHHPPPPPFISSLIHLKTTRTKLEGWLGFAEEFLVICSHIYGHCFPLVSSHSLQIQSALSMKIEWTRR